MEEKVRVNVPSFSLPKEVEDILKKIREGIPMKESSKIETGKHKVELKVLKTTDEDEPDSDLEKKAGCYIFVKENKAVYVGFVGKKINQEQKQDLKNRLKDHLKGKPDNSFVKNLIKKELGIDAKDITSEERKELIRRHTDLVITISTGNIKDEEAKKLARKLERWLICILEPKYNLE
ncbi:GIY-YIG nuclease family protein [Phorcysia thermohydrogeniphila]|uniref:GIY-YIG domain-containing protein n=1 Tax=Phorcysia thermohydrogeniphila TaxID=936138 RepID=A0A4R1G9F7_9BACT|nr:GIY-YIG nuclease family protein [Phorcysia thermohydrogeniphila]TCK04514.1 hypothetical protein CLV27_0945 [Phorcysia thermohydrogeniphila]